MDDLANLPDAPPDSRSLRGALGRYATGVAVVTARAASGEPVGLTCNSFVSLSLDPPLVQWSVALASRACAAMRGASHYAVHVLRRSQEPLSRQFASSQADRFAGLELEEGIAGLPLLRDCLARFECAAWAQHPAGDHVLLIGRVLRVRAAEGEPLLYYRGAYAGF